MCKNKINFLKNGLRGVFPYFFLALVILHNTMKIARAIPAIGASVVCMPTVLLVALVVLAAFTEAEFMVTVSSSACESRDAEVNASPAASSPRSRMVATV